MPVKIETNVPYANVGDVHVSQVGETAVVHFMPEPHGGPEAMWFCFRVRRCEDASVKRLRLVLTNMDNLLGGGGSGQVRPVARFARGEWQRLEAGQREPQPDGRTHAIWEIDAPSTFADVALCYPYGRPEIDQLIQHMQRQVTSDGGDGGDTWHTDTIGLSQGGRPLVRLSNDYGCEDDSEEGKRVGIYLLARQHSGETPGSWALDGFLRRMSELGKDAPLTWAVPLTNIDGVEQGDYGKDNFPYDLNRAWGQPPMRHETLVMQRDMRRWRKRCQPALVMDFHAPVICEDQGLYLFVPDEEAAHHHEQAQAWAEVMATALGPAYAHEDFVKIARYASRWNTANATRHAWEQLDVTGITLETPYSISKTTLLTVDTYRDAGARLAEVVTEHAGRIRGAMQDVSR